jgi:hypothetical protein
MAQQQHASVRPHHHLLDMNEVCMRNAVSLCMVGMVLGCAPSRPPAGSPATVAAPSSASVWSVDLVRTRAGQQAEYLRGIQANWAGARRLAVAGGEVRTYHALAAPPDSTRGWDVMLLTEFRDSTAFSASLRRPTLCSGSGRQRGPVRAVADLRRE